MNTEQQIRRRIEIFVRELQALLVETATESVVAALGGTPRPQTRSSGRGASGRSAPGRSAPNPRASGRAGARSQANGRVRRSADELAEVQERVLAVLLKKPGLTSEEIQSETALAKKQLQRPLSLLREEKRVKTRGQRRGMKYYAS